MDPVLVSFAGAFAGGAVAGLASAVVRWLKLEEKLDAVAEAAAARALKAHETGCTWRSIAASHVAGEALLTPSGRWPLKP